MIDARRQHAAALSRRFFFLLTTRNCSVLRNIRQADLHFVTLGGAQMHRPEFQKQES
nr:MAG TPA: hypothetical protein [Caudoviricetes sp.]